VSNGVGEPTFDNNARLTALHERAKALLAEYGDQLNGSGLYLVTYVRDLTLRDLARKAESK